VKLILALSAAAALAAPGQALARPEVSASIMTLQQVAPGIPATYIGVFSPPSHATGYGCCDSADALEDNFNPATSDCITGCQLDGSSLSYFSLQAYRFTAPVSDASIDVTSDSANQAFVQAFNGAGNLIGYCIGLDLATPSYQGNPGCFKVVVGGSGPGGPAEIQAWQFSIADSTPNIATLLVGSFNDGLDSAPFNLQIVPEPATPALFAFGLAGIGLARRRKPR
jgi:hypothetical protein